MEKLEELALEAECGYPIAYSGRTSTRSVRAPTTALVVGWPFRLLRVKTKILRENNFYNRAPQNLRDIEIAL